MVHKPGMAEHDWDHLPGLAFPLKPLPDFIRVHEEIAGLKKLGQLLDTVMGKRTIDWLQNEQPGAIAREAWVSGNQQGIERKIEFGELHQEGGGVGGLVSDIFCSSVPG